MITAYHHAQPSVSSDASWRCSSEKDESCPRILVKLVTS